MVDPGSGVRGQKLRQGRDRINIYVECEGGRVVSAPISKAGSITGQVTNPDRMAKHGEMDIAPLMEF